tara:strand:- start:8923 stop:9132 length:210 start_codon:yes stop_codon:yes gene_type:complete
MVKITPEIVGMLIGAAVFISVITFVIWFILSLFNRKENSVTGLPNTIGLPTRKKPRRLSNFREDEDGWD